MERTIIRSADEFESLRDEWNILAKRWASPVFDHAWFMSAARSLHAADELCVHIIREDGRLIAAAPLAVDRSRGRRRALLGVSKLYEPSGCLFAGDTAAKALIKSCLRDGESIILQRVPDYRSLATVVSAVGRGRAFMMSRPLAASHAVETSGSWDSYLAGLSRHKCRSLEKRKHRAEQAFGLWRFQMHHPALDEVEPLLELLATVEASGWKGRQGSSLSQRPDLRTFFAEYGRRAAADQQLRVAELRFGVRIAAIELLIEAHGRLWSLKIGYDEALSEFAPALQLTQESIRTAFERGLQSYEFLGVAASWQERWRPVRRQYGLIAIYPFGLGGVTGFARDAWASLASTRRAREA
jgi:CelD/BcsL family acetyltransferase involved in cellulose biosynthesis